jgi:hypothetical protein
VVGSQRRGVVNSFNFPCIANGLLSLSGLTCVTIQITMANASIKVGRTLQHSKLEKDGKVKKIIRKPVSMRDAGFPEIPAANWVCSRATKSLRNGNERVRRRPRIACPVGNRRQ